MIVDKAKSVIAAEERAKQIVQEALEESKRIRLDGERENAKALEEERKKLGKQLQQIAQSLEKQRNALEKRLSEEGQIEKKRFSAQVSRNEKKAIEKALDYLVSGK